MPGIVISSKKRFLVGKRIKEVEVLSATLDTSLFFSDLTAIGASPNTTLLSEELSALPLIVKNEASTVLTTGAVDAGRVFGMNGDTKSIEGFSFTRNSAGTRWSWDGKMYDSAANILRHDQDPKTGVLRGFLFEKASTNFLTYSGFTRGIPDILPGSTNVTAVNTGWNKGTFLDKGIKMTYNSGATVFAYKQYSSRVAGRNYVFSCFVKTSDGLSPTGAIGVHLFGGGYTNFNQEDYGSGIFRVWVTVNLTSTQSTSAGVFKLASSDNRDVTVSGYQLEEGEFPTSYIPSEGSAITRLEDVLTSNRPIDVFNEYSLYVKGAYTSGSSSYIQKDSTSIYWYQAIDNIDNYNVSSYNGTVALKSSAPEKQEIKFVLRRNKDSFSHCVNSGAIQTSLNVFPINNVPLIIRGSNSSFTLRHLAIIPRKLTNQELQTLTS